MQNIEPPKPKNKKCMRLSSSVRSTTKVSAFYDDAPTSLDDTQGCSNSQNLHTFPERFLTTTPGLFGLGLTQLGCRNPNLRSRKAMGGAP